MMKPIQNAKSKGYVILSQYRPGKRSDEEISEIQWVDKNTLVPYLQNRQKPAQR